MSNIVDIKMNGREFTLYPFGGRCDLIFNGLNYTVYSQRDGNGGFFMTVTVRFRPAGWRRHAIRRLKPQGKVGKQVIAYTLFPQSA